MRRNVLPMLPEGWERPVVECEGRDAFVRWTPGNLALDPDEARGVAGALLEAADLADEQRGLAEQVRAAWRAFETHRGGKEGNVIDATLPPERQVSRGE